MAVDLTLRLVKGTELTFSEIDNNWQLLDHAIDSNDSYYKGQINNLDSDLSVLESKFDSSLDSAVNKIIRDHDSDMDALLQEHDSDINWLITNGSARHDSEHAWNVQEHKNLDSDLRFYVDSSITILKDSFQVIINNLDSSVDDRLDSLSLELSEIVGGLTIDSNAPNPAKEGEMWLDTVDDLVKVYDGDYWFEFPTSSQIDSTIVNSLIDQNTITEIIDSSYVSNLGALFNVVEDTTPELGGDLVLGQNQLVFATGGGTVSHIDFTKNLFGGTNDFVLSSVQGLSVFLDANGGGSHSFKIFSNTNPDGGSVLASNAIFDVDESGNADATSFNASSTLTVGNWSLAEVGGELVISKSGTKKAKIKANGEIVSLNDMTAFGTV